MVEPAILPEKQASAQSLLTLGPLPHGGLQGCMEQSNPLRFHAPDTYEEYPMADVSANGQAGQPQLVLQKIYIKDVSYEAPNAPQIFQDVGETELQPQVALNLAQKSTDMGNDLFEVVLSLTLTCSLGERTAYLAEVHQAGVFSIAGFTEEDQAGILASYCPNLLFPYARQMLSSLVLEGGFPPFLLQPINFDALYAEQQRRILGGSAVPTLNS
jgi:preprotein translocase subunit SecB